MSMPRSIRFKYGNTVEPIRVTKILNEYDEKCMKEKIIDFARGDMSDKISMKSNKGDRMGLSDLYDAQKDDEPINVELIKASGD